MMGALPEASVAFEIARLTAGILALALMIFSAAGFLWLCQKVGALARDLFKKGPRS
jgi:hypothetical protein